MKHNLPSLITTILLFFCAFTGFAQGFWEIINTPPGIGVSPIAINSNEDIFFGTGGGVYRSMDEGISWELMGLENKTIYSLAINELGYIYAGSTGGLSNYSIHRSVDNGQSWEGIYLGSENVICIKSFPGGLMFATSGTGSYISVIMSTDYGNTWQEVITFPSNTEYPYDIAIQNQDTIYIGTTNYIGGGGVYRSTDGGDTWEHIGLTDCYVSSLAFNSSGDLFAGTRGHYSHYSKGVFILPSGQSEWININNDELVTSMVINSKNEIYIGCSNLDGILGGVRRSRDNGQTWENINAGMGNQDIEELVLDSEGYLYASVRNSPTPLFKSIRSTEIPILDGSITYANTNATPLSNTHVKLMQGDSIIRDTTTDATGYFYFTDINNGIYTINITPAKPWGGATAGDVLLYRKHIANISSLNSIYLASGDVNGSGDLTAVDVLLIKKRIAHLIDAFPAGDWLFNNQPVMINGTNVTYNFSGICYGDANGSYVPTAK